MKAPHVSRWVFAAILTLGRTAQAADPQAVADAKAAYLAAVTKSTQEITEIYKAKLLEMKQKHAAAGDNAGVIAISDELTRIGAPSPVLAQTGGTTPASSAKSPSPTEAAAPASPTGDERFFAGKSWLTPDARSEFHFNRDGTGWRKNNDDKKLPFTWKKLDGGLIHVTGTLLQGGPLVNWYFAFTNRRNAFFGNTQSSLPSPLISN